MLVALLSHGLSISIGTTLQHLPTARIYFRTTACSDSNYSCISVPLYCIYSAQGKQRCGHNWCLLGLSALPVCRQQRVTNTSKHLQWYSRRRTRTAVGGALQRWSTARIAGSVPHAAASYSGGAARCHASSGGGCPGPQVVQASDVLGRSSRVQISKLVIAIVS